MKTISYFFLMIIAVSTLAACDAGKGPSKPASTSSVESPSK
ncbi:MAG: hypothetical protein ACXW1W_06440 [Methylococcaceae bacterium]